MTFRLCGQFHLESPCAQKLHNHKVLYNVNKKDKQKVNHFMDIFERKNLGLRRETENVISIQTTECQETQTCTNKKNA